MDKLRRVSKVTERRVSTMYLEQLASVHRASAEIFEAWEAGEREAVPGSRSDRQAGEILREYLKLCAHSMDNIAMFFNCLEDDECLSLIDREIEQQRK